MLLLYLRLLSNQIVEVVVGQLDDGGPQDVLDKARQLLGIVGAVVAVGPTLCNRQQRVFINSLRGCVIIDYLTHSFYYNPK